MAGGYVLKEALHLQQNIEKMFGLYPILRERQNQQAGTLSGGEQQMLAICRGLMAEPKLILLDEPSLGLGPIIVNGVFQLIKRIREQGITVVLVEQNARKALALCDYAYVLENGRIAMRGQGRDLLCDTAIKKAYLGEC
jgi:branched-chain amino acid transport system ATP-binding protein